MLRLLEPTREAPTIETAVLLGVLGGDAETSAVVAAVPWRRLSVSTDPSAKEVSDSDGVSAFSWPPARAGVCPRVNTVNVTLCPGSVAARRLRNEFASCTGAPSNETITAPTIAGRLVDGALCYGLLTATHATENRRSERSQVLSAGCFLAFGVMAPRECGRCKRLHLLPLPLWLCYAIALNFEFSMLNA